MIDLDKTILKTIEENIKMQAFQAKDDSKTRRLVLSLIILQDLMEWCESKEDDNRTYKIIRDLQYKLIRNNYDALNIVKDYFSDEILAYRNVNTPQTRYTWQRVFDKGTSVESKEETSELVLGEVITEQDYLLNQNCNLYGR